MHGTFSRIDHVLGHKRSLSKFKTFKIIKYVFSDHKGLKIEISNKNNFRYCTNTWKLNNILLNDQRRNQKKVQKFYETNEN